jgi:hypothetical protein
MATKFNREKRVDLPPTGTRNADPITNAPGSHPIETGVGAAAGALGAMAVGAVAGPAGAVAGGYAGKGVGEIIDPTTDDNWLRENFNSRPYVRQGDTFETYHPAYRYGAEVESQYGEDDFDTIEPDVRRGWESQGSVDMPWHRARGAVKDSFERTIQIRRARDVPEVCDDVQED